MHFKRMFLLGALTVAVVGAEAVPLTPKQALHAAVQRSQQSRLQTNTASELAYDHVYTVTDSATAKPTVYVFANLSGAGFIVASADDCAVPLLGYSDEGGFDPANINPAFSQWLEGYSSQIAVMAEDANVTMTDSPIPGASDISPLIKSHWDQSAPFNNDCPIVVGRRSVTGCVATAFSQVMYYHKWPQSAGAGSHSYSWIVNDVTYTESMDYSQITFDWANMIDNYTSSATVAQQSAVAQLMHAVGVSCDMGYTPRPAAQTLAVP